MTTFKTKENWVAFMAHLPLSEFDSIIQELDSYNPQRYIVAYEGTPYEHYHFLVQADNVEQFYTRFRKHVFIDKYKLRGDNMVR